MKQSTKLFKALSDTNRLRIVKMLEVRPLCVCEIVDVLQLATSTVSKHLSILREADLIEAEKDGKWVNYKLNTSEPGSLHNAFLNFLETRIPADDVSLSDKQKVQTTDRNVICGIE